MTAQIVLIRHPDELRPGDIVVEPTNAEEREAAARMLTAYVRREIPETLPTRPGYYIAARPAYEGEPVVVELLGSPAEQWVDGGDRTYLDEAQVRALGELHRLVDLHLVTAFFRREADPERADDWRLRAAQTIEAEWEIEP